MSSAKGAVEKEEFKLNDDMKEFLKILEITGTKVDLTTPEGQRAFSVDYNRWVADGRKKPELPISKEEPPIPMKLYRSKHYGEQMLSFRDTKADWHGREVKDGKTTKFLTKFTKTDAQKLVDDAMKRCHHPTFYFENAGRKVEVSPKEFVDADFDGKIGSTGRA